jgi:hypothetical protein
MEKARMQETYRFKYLGHTKREDGTIERYAIAVTALHNGRTEEISVEPTHLVSARSMKRILLERSMFYSVAQKEHLQMLYEILPKPGTV